MQVQGLIEGKEGRRCEKAVKGRKGGGKKSAEKVQKRRMLKETNMLVGFRVTTVTT